MNNGLQRFAWSDPFTEALELNRIISSLTAYPRRRREPARGAHRSQGREHTESGEEPETAHRNEAGKPKGGEPDHDHGRRRHDSLPGDRRGLPQATRCAAVVEIMKGVIHGEAEDHAPRHDRRHVERDAEPAHHAEHQGHREHVCRHCGEHQAQ